MVDSVDHASLGPLRQEVHRSRRALGNQHVRVSARWRLLILAPFALFLVWEVITRSVVAYLADASPDMAIRLRSDYPTALLNLAHDRVRDLVAEHTEPAEALPRDGSSRLTIVAKGLQNPKDANLIDKSEPVALDNSTVANSSAMAQARSWVELALLQDPLNARALLLLGQLSQGATKGALMKAAARRSLLESEAVFQAMRKDFEDGDYRSAGLYADVLLRTRPQSDAALRAAMTVLGKIAETPGTSGELKQLLASNPPWRGEFFRRLPMSVSDARTPLDLLLALRGTAMPPTIAEISPYLNFLTEHAFYDLAYYSWLQFLPPEQLSRAGHLFNGSFELTPTGLPFDWTLTKQSGVTMEIAERTDGKGAHALYMEFGVGRVEGFGISQMVVLAPGDYQFRGEYKADLVSQRGLQWRVVCASKERRVIGESPTILGAASDWKDLEFAFTVPTADCPFQSVELAFAARSASEQFVSGSVWLDDLQITGRKNADR
jgi:hypothetical protein